MNSNHNVLNQQNDRKHDPHVKQQTQSHHEHDLVNNNSQTLQGSDQFDPLKSSELKKSDLKQQFSQPNEQTNQDHHHSIEQQKQHLVAQNKKFLHATEQSNTKQMKQSLLNEQYTNLSKELEPWKQEQQQSQSMKKSNLNNNDKSSQGYQLQLFDNKISLHEYYPALSKQIIQEQQLKLLEEKIKNNQQEEYNYKLTVSSKDKNHHDYPQHHKDYHKGKNGEFQLNDTDQQQDEQTPFFTKKGHDNLKQYLQNAPALKSKLKKNPINQKFHHYLNNEIQKQQINQTQSPLNYNQNYYYQSLTGLQSPILRNLSQKSDSTLAAYYHPQMYASNINSRLYIPNLKKLTSNSLGIQSIPEFNTKEFTDLTKQRFNIIFDHYAEAYLQPTQKYNTFDNVKDRQLNFQSFCHFAKDFNILRNMFSLETIKKVYKKYSQFGKVLKFSNFVSVVQGLAHEKQCNQYFQLQKMVPNMNQQTRKQLEIQELYGFLGIFDEASKLKDKFSNKFRPFNCQKDIELPKIKLIRVSISQIF